MEIKKMILIFLPTLALSLASCEQESSMSLHMNDTCNYKVDLDNDDIGSGFTTIGVTVETDTHCMWSVETEGEEWIEVSSTESDKGSGKFEFFIFANSSSESREARFTIGNKTLRITQSAYNCEDANSTSDTSGLFSNSDTSGLFPNDGDSSSSSNSCGPSTPVTDQGIDKLPASCEYELIDTEEYDTASEQGENSLAFTLGSASDSGFFILNTQDACEWTIEDLSTGNFDFVTLSKTNGTGASIISFSAYGVSTDAKESVLTFTIVESIKGSPGDPTDMPTVELKKGY